MSEPRSAPWPVRALRIVAWVWHIAGLGVAAIMWLNSRETVTTTRTITAHARLTFQDIETQVSAFRVSAGFLLAGLTAWAVLLVICSIAEKEQRFGGGKSLPGRDRLAAPTW